MKSDTLALFALGAGLVLAAIWLSRRPQAVYVPVGYSGKDLAELYL